jgi:hypothetical protein
MPGMGLFFLGVIACGGLFLACIPFLIVWAVPRLRGSKTAMAVSLLPVAAVLFGFAWFAADGYAAMSLVNAAGHGDVRKVRTLLRAGARPDSAGFYGEPTALEAAVSNQQWEAARILIEAGATDLSTELSAVPPSKQLEEAGQLELSEMLRAKR